MSCGNNNHIISRVPSRKPHQPFELAAAASLLGVMLHFSVDPPFRCRWHMLLPSCHDTAWLMDGRHCAIFLQRKVQDLTKRYYVHHIVTLQAIESERTTMRI
jgi:hypothetical protein